MALFPGLRVAPEAAEQDKILAALATTLQAYPLPTSWWREPLPDVVPSLCRDGYERDRDDSQALQAELESGSAGSLWRPSGLRICSERASGGRQPSFYYTSHNPFWLRSLWRKAGTKLGDVHYTYSTCVSYRLSHDDLVDVEISREKTDNFSREHNIILTYTDRYHPRFLP